jgi:peptidoglycan-associated lipoprotein
MEGSIGDYDIWKVERESASAEWGEPVNLGEEINTEGREVYPFIHPDGTLYFSSDGLLGMGGLDIFRAEEKTDGSWEVENMKYPVNSSADDFGIVFEAEKERGYFSSSRTARGDDDIFQFMLPPLRFNITGTVKDEKTDEPLSGAIVKSISSAGLTIETKTDEEGEFKFMLKPTTDYLFIASKEEYLNGKERESTKGLTQSQDFETTIYLASIDKPIELPNIFYDFADWKLRPESRVSLDNLVETLNDNPNITIELMSHTDNRGGEQSNLELSQKRAQSAVDYLISKGIDPDRLTAKGYGESVPKTLDEKTAERSRFFSAGDTLTEEFINNLDSPEKQEMAHQINRRTEFKVLRTDYVPKEK